MSSRFPLLLPYLCGALVILAVSWGNLHRTATVAGLASLAAAVDGSDPARGEPRRRVDPVCNMEVGGNIETRYLGESWFFCTDRCREIFNRDPRRYRTESCLVCRSDDVFTPVGRDAACAATWQGKSYRFCSTAHRDAFHARPLDYFMHSMWGLPGWLYYCSIAVLLVLSFGVIEWRALSRRNMPSSASPASDGAGGGAPAAGRPRIDLFRSAWLRRLLPNPIFRFSLRALLVALFLLIIAAGLFGNQLPSKNVAPLLTWTIWWGGLIWLVLYFGKSWCYVCPWDAIAEWSERLALWGKRRARLSLGLEWPRFMRSIWPATLLFIGLTWIELGFGVTLNPRVTAWLGLLILGLAFVSAFVFDRKSFCRYGCLVGRISGLYALFAPVELRARDRDVCRSCRTRSCYKGNDDGEGCPTFEFPAVMNQNTYCILCMECVKTCEADNIALRLRPWGEDLFAHRKPRADEAYLALIMLSLTGFHGLTMTAAWRSATGWVESALGLGETSSFSAGMGAIMLAPVLLYALLVALSRWLSGAARIGYREYFIRYAYALLPIALFYHLAHNSEHLFLEGQKVLALMSDPFGFEWNLLGTAGWTLQPLVGLPALWLLQVFFVAVGHVFSLWAARRAATSLFPDARAALRSQVPMLAAMILFSIMSLWLLKQPMEMRTSAM
ncbi:MAG: YHS domain-containing protein [Candidatus Krumholzibacteriia bacterium]